MGQTVVDNPATGAEPNPQDEPGEELQQETEAEPENSGPASEPKQKRRLFKRIGPQQLTPEQEAEAERLRKLAAKYGTDPTAIVSRVQLTTQYADLVQGAHATESTLRVDLAFRGNWLLRVDAPFLKWNDPNRSGASSATGMSDLFATLGWRIYNTPEYAFLIGALSSYPTADQTTLGLGKYTAGPFAATARFIPRWESFLIGVFQHQVSVGGDPSRSNVSLTRATVQINTFWAERWWTVLQGVWQINWEKSAQSSMTMEAELGRSLVGRLGAFLRPGVGVWGQNTFGTYQWNVEIGVRYMFTSF